MIFHPTSGEADGDGQKDMGDLSIMAWIPLSTERCRQ
jgi:hypothetical protein